MRKAGSTKTKGAVEGTGRASMSVIRKKLLDHLPATNHTGSDGSLSPVEQDWMCRAEKLLNRAVQVLEDEEAAFTWLTTGNRSLGGVLPLALLDVEMGYELVLDTLGRIEYGVVS